MTTQIAMTIADLAGGEITAMIVTITTKKTARRPLAVFLYCDSGVQPLADGSFRLPHRVSNSLDSRDFVKNKYLSLR
jgi:hypothetical protein